MRIKINSLILILLPIFYVYGQSSQPSCENCPSKEKTETIRKCPDASKITFLCSEVAFVQRDPNPLSAKYKYLYQRKILEAACVDLNRDSKEEIAKKVSGMWEKFEKDLHCSNTQFDVSKGSLIKFAIASSFDTFIYDVIDWKVDLNKVDLSDQRTVLDYVRDQKTRLKGTALEDTMQEYYEVLREAGAKHKSEL